MKRVTNVFHASKEIENDVVDIDGDPNFESPSPTWGICRPQLRKTIQVGDKILFVGVFDGDKYFIKGIFEVAEKISYIEALQRFGNRKNVIIQEKLFEQNVRRERKWKRKNIENIVKQKFETVLPDFMTSIKYGEKVYEQNDKDNHEMDNWKCQRIFRCQESTLEKCIEHSMCHKDEEFAKENNYIVFDIVIDVGMYKISIHDVLPYDLLKKIKTPKNQHNYLKIPDVHLSKIIEDLSLLNN